MCHLRTSSSAQSSARPSDSALLAFGVWKSVTNAKRKLDFILPTEQCMAKFFLFPVLVVAMSGCGGGGSSGDAIIKQQIALNKAAAADLAQIKDLADLSVFLYDYVKKRKQVLEKIRYMPKEKINEFVQRLERESKESRDQLDEAMADFHKRLKDGKSYPQVLMETSMGPVTIELWEDLAPITVKNFLDYVNEKYYDGLIFHRVISDFM